MALVALRWRHPPGRSEAALAATGSIGASHRRQGRLLQGEGCGHRDPPERNVSGQARDGPRSHRPSIGQDAQGPHDPHHPRRFGGSRRLGIRPVDGPHRLAIPLGATARSRLRREHLLVLGCTDRTAGTAAPERAANRGWGGVGPHPTRIAARHRTPGRCHIRPTATVSENGGDVLAAHRSLTVPQRTPPR
jgi:hypothetical protein